MASTDVLDSANDQMRMASALMGNSSAFRFKRRTKALSDANTTLTSSEYDAPILEFTGTLTAGRDVVLPNTEGATYIVFNNGTGQNLTFKVSGQTGVAVATTKRAILYCNGTDYVRVTPDT